jgi:hypothetical protein
MRKLSLVLLVLALFAAVLPAAAQNEGNCPSEGRPVRNQVRFLNFSDIPAYLTAAEADAASAILSGEVVADQIPQPAVRIRGGNQQKYLLCGPFAAGDGSVRIILGSAGRLVWVPEYLISNIVPRNFNDRQG